MVVDVQNLGVDFLVASSHKVSLFLCIHIFDVFSWFMKLRDKHSSDVWAYRRWFLVWKKRALGGYASVLR